LEGVFHYSPVQSKPQLLRGLVRDFVEQALGGSLEPFVSYLAEEVDLSEEEVERLRSKIRELPGADTEQQS
jgi:predicted transcriptional regulator